VKLLERLIKKEVNRLLMGEATNNNPPLTNNSQDNSDPFTDTGNQASGTLPVLGGVSSSSMSSSEEDKDNPFGDDNNQDSEENPFDEDEQEETPKEPKEEVMSFVEDTIKTTTDVPTILKGVKSLIQKRYSSLTSAREVVDELKNSDDLTKKSCPSLSHS
jgi:hypothetical protein